MVTLVIRQRLRLSAKLSQATSSINKHLHTDIRTKTLMNTHPNISR